MANPQLPIQAGSNLPGLEREQDLEKAALQDAEIDRKSTRLNSSH